MLDLLIARQVALASAERERLHGLESQGAAITTAAVAALALGATGFSTVLAGANRPILYAAGAMLVASVICGTIGRAPNPAPLRMWQDWDADKATEEKISRSQQIIATHTENGDPTAVRREVLSNWEGHTELARMRADVKSEWTTAALIGLQSAFLVGVLALVFSS